MNISEITEKVGVVFCETFKNPEIVVNEATTADDVEGWDSITHLDLIVAVEKMFDIEINGFDVMGLQNVGDLISLVQRKLEDQ